MRHIRLAHEALANQERSGAITGQIRQIFGRVNATFGNDGFVCWYAVCKRAGRVQRDIEGVEIAVVDANQCRVERKAAVQFSRVMHLDQRIHAPGAGGGF